MMNRMMLMTALPSKSSPVAVALQIKPSANKLLNESFALSAHFSQELPL
jgi:hypothetical protein